MFRFVLQVAFLRAILRARPVKIVLLVVLMGSVLAGVVYTYVVFQAVAQRSESHHVHPHSLR
jgi:flagellar basal body-associated protein FliL